MFPVSKVIINNFSLHRHYQNHQLGLHIYGYYTLILPKFLSVYGTAFTKEYLGNPNDLKVLKKGDIIFGAEGNEKGMSLAIVEEQEKLNIRLVLTHT